MLSSTAQKTAPSHRRQNSTPAGITSAASAALAPSTNHHQHPLHRRGLSTGYSAHIQDLGPMDKSDGKVSTNNSNRQPGQQHMRAAQTPATSRPGQDDLFLYNSLHSESSPPQNQPHYNHHQQQLLPQKQNQYRLAQVNEHSELSEIFPQSVNHPQSKADQQSQGPSEFDAARKTETNPAAAMLLEFMEKMNRFPSQEVKQAMHGKTSPMTRGFALIHCRS